MWGPRQLRLGWHHPKGDIPDKKSPLDERLNHAITHEPGDIYCSNMAATFHQVAHQHQTDRYHENRETWYIDGRPRKVAVMLRANSFPGIARTTKNPPAPQAVWDILCGEMAAIFTAREIKLPMLHEVLREHARLESLESAEVSRPGKNACGSSRTKDAAKSCC